LNKNPLSTKDILSILLDDTNLKILKLLDGKEQTIQQISSLLDIPLSSTYRKIGKLEKLGLIKKTKVVRTLDGLDESVYTLWTYEIIVNYKDNFLSFKIKQKPLDDKIIRLWQKFQH
jgi:DNA-binding transcriptional ArsR family regulator